ncbi:TRIM2 [Branchiostoma lanceolatum]|uniref:TRIM2 protein n=1 Tax=Branchiostoma lanceolatum TaxID=7740 RepID=A0A8J9YT58_BRALA|nr:TRIM2 [Branchiostoma lanceolatum]
MAVSPRGHRTHVTLSCSICFEEFPDAKLLPCCHSFCWRCLINHEAERADFPCPVCGRTVHVPPEGIRGLPEHIPAEDLLTRLEPGENKHPGIEPENGDQFCQRCRVPVTSERVRSRNHSGHKITPYQHPPPIPEEVRSQARPVVEKCLDGILGLHDRQKNIDASLRVLQKNKLKIADEIRGETQIWIAAILARQDQLLRVLEDRTEEQRSDVVDGRRKVQAKIAEMSTLWGQMDDNLSTGTFSAEYYDHSVNQICGLEDGTVIENTGTESQPNVVFIPKPLPNDVVIVGELASSIH